MHDEYINFNICLFNLTLHDDIEYMDYTILRMHVYNNEVWSKMMNISNRMRLLKS